MKSFLLITAILFGLLSCAHHLSWPKSAMVAPRANPTEGKSEAIGFYSRGCLKGGKTFKGNERGLIVSQTRRGRFWAHSDLIDILTELGEFSHRVLKKAVVVGDLSLSRGGPTVGGHNSHQNGLDVDLWFHLFKQDKVGSSFGFWQTEAMKSALKDNSFGKDQEMILSFLSQDKRVQRIFVHPKIKKILCENPSATFNEDQLAKIRPWYGHDDHLHLRLFCPEGNKNCEPQKDVPKGSDCDQLDWWFSDEAKAAEEGFDYSYQNQRYKYMETLNQLPAVCQSIYKDVQL